MNRRSRLMTAVCASFLPLAASVVLADGGKCLRAQIPLPMVFPDGSEHPAGTLTLCVADYSPVASYHKVSVNGLPVGFLFSQRRLPERQSITEPVVLFRMTHAGTLRLMGYLWPAGRKVSSYLLQGEPWDEGAQTRIPAAETPFPPARVEELPPPS